MRIKDIFQLLSMLGLALFAGFTLGKEQQQYRASVQLILDQISSDLCHLEDLHNEKKQAPHES
jgi:hypothetical protein